MGKIHKLTKDDIVSINNIRIMKAIKRSTITNYAINWSILFFLILMILMQLRQVIAAYIATAGFVTFLAYSLFMYHKTLEL